MRLPLHRGCRCLRLASGLPTKVMISLFVSNVLMKSIVAVILIPGIYLIRSNIMGRCRRSMPYNRAFLNYCV